MTTVLNKSIRHIFLSLLVFIVVISSSCSKKYQSIQSIDNQEHEIPPALLKEVRDLSPSLVIPYEDKVIKTYFHFFNNVDSTLNYNEGRASSVVYDLLENASRRMENNDPMNLPLGNNTSVRKSHIKYKLAEYNGKPGIFYHYEKSPKYFVKKGKKSNLYDRKIIKEYALRSDSVLNVFVLPFNPEQIASGEQKLERTAIALGTTIKLPGIYQRGIPAWEYAGIFNHEVGHVLSLRHSWNSNDGCEDTPLNDNCWVTSKEPPCEGLQSNNLMDYNAHQSAITPCQIARMQASLVNPGKAASKLVEDDECRHLGHEYEIITMEKWSQPVRLSGDLVIAKNGILYVRSLLQMSQNSKITIKKGGTLILENASIYNSCGYDWDGIFKHPKGQLFIIGKNCRLQNLPKSNQIVDGVNY